MQITGLLADSHAIAQTASVLGVSPLRVFELAYQDWYGASPSSGQIDQDFVAYIFDGRVPCWVRAFNRATLGLCEEAGMTIPVTQDSHKLTLMVSPTRLMMTVLGLATLCLLWLLRHG